jgi:hypothetical protein
MSTLYPDDFEPDGDVNLKDFEMIAKTREQKQATVNTIPSVILKRKSFL